jgi:hypothetical protein
MATSIIDWNTATTSGFVRVRTHNIFFRAAGSKKNPNDPSVLIIPGLSAGSASWLTVFRLISSFARVYIYDRSGRGKSDPAPADAPITAANMALELKLLLDTAGVSGPWVVVAHGYGGIIAREFGPLMNENEDDVIWNGVVAMVLVHCMTEFSDDVRPEGLKDAYCGLLDGGAVSVPEIVKMEERHRMNAKEWAAYNYKGTEEEQKKWEKVSMRENAGVEVSFEELREKKQYEKNVMGSGLLIVIKGNTTEEVKKVLDWAEEGGKGTEKQRALVRKWLGMEQEENRVQKD